MVFESAFGDFVKQHNAAILMLFLLKFKFFFFLEKTTIKLVDMQNNVWFTCILIFGGPLFANADVNVIWNHNGHHFPYRRSNIGFLSIERIVGYPRLSLRLDGIRYSFNFVISLICFSFLFWWFNSPDDMVFVSLSLRFADI